MKMNAIETAELISALARSLSPQALGVVREIMNDDQNHPAVRLRAADMILTRAIGVAGKTLEDESNATVIFETVYDAPPATAGKIVAITPPETAETESNAPATGGDSGDSDSRPAESETDSVGRSPEGGKGGGDRTPSREPWEP